MGAHKPSLRTGSWGCKAEQFGTLRLILGEIFGKDERETQPLVGILQGLCALDPDWDLHGRHPPSCLDPLLEHSLSGPPLRSYCDGAACPPTPQVRVRVFDQAKEATIPHWKRVP
jgi:hypothetical protein